MKNIFVRLALKIIFVLQILSLINYTNSSRNLKSNEVKMKLKISSTNNSSTDSKSNEIAQKNVLNKKEELTKTQLSLNSNINSKLESNKNTNLLQSKSSNTSLIEKSKLNTKVKTNTESESKLQAQAAFEIAKKKYELDRLNAFAELII